MQIQNFGHWFRQVGKQKPSIARVTGFKEKACKAVSKRKNRASRHFRSKTSLTQFGKDSCIPCLARLSTSHPAEPVPNFVAGSDNSGETLGLELSLKLYSQPKPNREPVKILVIGSREGVNTIVHTLHRLKFAEVFEWTDFLNAPENESLNLRTGEVMKVLVRYLFVEP